MQLSNKELFAYFQPIFRMDDESLFGLEVLARRAVRSRHQPPALFFHLLHGPKSWLRIDLSALRHAARAARLIPRQRPVHLFVNLSTATALDREALGLYLSMLRRTVKQVGPHCLVVEIPEEYSGTPMQVAELCFRLRQAGALVALDDHRGVAADTRREAAWLWDVVKIDTGDRHMGDPVATLDTVLQRRRQAHLDQPLIILEGIEEAHHARQFARFGDRLLVQGYAFCRPAPLDEALGARSLPERTSVVASA